MAPRTRKRADRVWGPWHPVASDFHFGTKDPRWADAEERLAVAVLQASRARVRPPPAPFKTSQGRGITLPFRKPRGEFLDVLLSRRTWRGFGDGPLSLADLGTMLHLTFGYQMEGRSESGAHVVFKTSPSSGARHPIEAYVIALRVSHLPQGLYHYSPRTERLHLVKRGTSRRRLNQYLGGQTWFSDAPAVILMSAMLPRVWARYEHPRAYRSVLLGAGHLCQTFCLVATWLGLAPFCTQALNDSLIERDLGIDGVEEVILYAAGVGRKPADGRWVQWPGQRPIPRHSSPPAKRSGR